ncbi:MAG: 4Fe-4S dicluster domain-containing protein [Planctomycetaceae bacterium]|nr:4Fe-4S dicluster domain-containing protein [Planctomycetaceae bacterium]
MTRLFDRRTVHLYWFSGSGNSLIAALALAGRFRELGLTVELRALEDHDPCELDPTAVFGLVFPTHCFTMPEIVRQYVEQLPHVDRVPAFMVNTVGATTGGGVRGPLKRLLTDKGFVCHGAKVLLMPDSFFAFIHGWLARRMIRSAIRRVQTFADRLTAGQARWRRIPVMTDAWAALMRRLFAGRRLLARRLRYMRVVPRPKTCTRCGVCAKHCPVGALSFGSLEEANPEHDERDRKRVRHATKPIKSPPEPNQACVLCLRCVAICPSDAMRFRLLMLPPYRPEPQKELLRIYDENGK